MAAQEGINMDALSVLTGTHDSLDMATFEQILEMDDDEDEREFSRSIVFGFFDQAENTFKQMGEKLEDEDLEGLSQLGHFLKGSSATLGLTQMKNSCEKIQHLGHGEDETGSKKQPKEDCLEAIKVEVVKLRKEYETVKRALKACFGNTPPAE